METKTTEAQEKLIACNPHLIPVTRWTGSNYALAARNIKTELARAFPGHKFSVRSNSYSMGNSVTISWTDGPLASVVQEIINRYCDSTFDGMDDSTHYVPTIWTETFGAAKHVSANRHESRELTVQAAATMGITLTDASFDAHGSIIRKIGDPDPMTIYQRARGMTMADSVTAGEVAAVNNALAPVVPIRTTPTDAQFKAIAEMFTASIAVDGDRETKANARLITAELDLLAVYRAIAALARPCEECHGTGQDPRSERDACRYCGGVGETCAAGEELGNLRAAIARAESEQSEQGDEYRRLCDYLKVW